MLAVLSAWFLFLPSSAAADINLVGETEETEKIPGGGIASAHSPPSAVHFAVYESSSLEFPIPTKNKLLAEKKEFFSLRTLLAVVVPASIFEINSLLSFGY